MIVLKSPSFSYTHGFAALDFHSTTDTGGFVSVHFPFPWDPNEKNSEERERKRKIALEYLQAALAVL